MKRKVRLTETQLIDILKRKLTEHQFYSPLSMDKIIHDEMSFEDKKELYRLVTNIENEGMEKLTSKMQEIASKLIDKLGESKKSYVKDYLKRMVGKMILVHRKENSPNKDESVLNERCWKGYTQKGMKTMFGKRYPNCVKIKK